MVSAPYWMMLNVLLFAVGEPGQPTARYLQHETVLHEAAPISTLPALDDQRWVGLAGSAVWGLDPGGYRAVRVQLAGGSQLDRKADIRTWPLPKGIDLGPNRTAFLGLAPWGEAGVWLVDGVTQSFWRLAGEAWEGPWPLADAVADAVALSDAELLVQTPAHSHYTLAVVAAEGEVKQRLGGRRQAALPVLDRVENTWHVALSRDGSMVYLAHAYRAVVQVLRRDGTKIGEVALDSPQARRLAAEQDKRVGEIVVDPETGCAACKLVRLTTAVSVDQAGMLALRLGRAPAVELIDGEGRWHETVPIHGPGIGQEWISAGFVLHERGLFTMERVGLQAYGWREAERAAVLRVVDEDGQPVSGARVRVRMPGGVEHDLESGSDGEVFLPQPPSETEAFISAEARGFRRFEVLGLFHELAARPLVLERADTLCVIAVEEASRAPVAEYELAVLRPLEGADRAGIESGPKTSVADDDGHGCIQAPWAYPVDLEVRAEGFARQQVKLAERPEEPVEVALEPAAALRLHVADQAGGAVVGATVNLWPGEHADRLEQVTRDGGGTTDERGLVVINNLRSGRYRATIRCQGFLDWQADWELAAGEGERRVVLDRGARVVVRAVDRASAAPIAGARVELQGHGEVNRRLECTTGPDGRCLIHAVPPGTLRAVAQPEGRPEASKKVAIAAGQREVSVELLCSLGVRLRGTVHGVEWYPDLSLVVRVGAPGMGVRQTPVGADGQFAFEETPVGSVNLWVRDSEAGGSLLYRRLSIDVERDPQELDLHLPRPVVLVGSVQQGDAPCAQCRARLTLESAEVAPPVSDRRTDVKGLFEARLPQAGSYRLQIWTREGELAWDAGLRLSMDSEQTFELAGATVVGRIVDKQGAPVSSATVMASSASDGTLLRRVSTDGRGAFHMDRLASGLVRLHASHVGAAGQQEILVHAGQTETVEIILEREDGLALRLRDAGSGTAVQVATFGIQDWRGGYLVLGQRGDPTGLFTLPVQPNEVAAVVVAAPRFALATVRNPGAGARPLEVPLWANYRAFTLEVRPEAGQPCSVELLARDGLPVALTVSAPPVPLPLQSPTGLFNLLAPGTYTLVMTPCRGKPLARPLSLLEGVDPPHVVFP